MSPDYDRLTPMALWRHDVRLLWRRYSSRRAIWAVPLLASVLVTASFSKEKNAVAEVPAPSVTVARPLATSVEQWDDFVGRFEPSRTVDVKPRISGQIVATHFVEGALVNKGQLLFTIDPRPFEAALAEAAASVFKSRSDLALAQTNLTRALKLLGDEAVSQSRVDELRATVQTARADLAAAQARVRSRRLELEFTRIRAPISGRVSAIEVDPGNLVNGGDSAGTLLTTINTLDPIHFTFDISEALLLKAMRTAADGSAGRLAEVRLQDEADYRWKGSMDFIDNGLGRSSGSIRARATLRNPDNFLTPGMFGNMRLREGGTRDVLLVPDAAVQTDQTRKTLMIVSRTNSVTTRPVTLGPRIGTLRIIEAGLSPSDRVIISGLQYAVPGSKVTPKESVLASDQMNRRAEPAATAPSASQATFSGR